MLSGPQGQERRIGPVQAYMGRIWAVYGPYGPYTPYGRIYIYTIYMVYI